MMNSKLRITALASAALLSMSALAACGSDASDKGGDDDKSVTIGMAAGWDEDIAVSHLWKHVLEDKGYEVELKELDVAPVFIGVAKGDLDLFFDTWLPVTHEDYWKQYKDKVVDLGSWYDEATLNIAVPEYMDVETIGDLKGMEKELDSTITGIDPGAGLTRITKDEAIPAYGLKNFDLKTSSTPAMLAGLKKSIDEKKPIVVTLWHPHWAYSAFPIKDLKDPKGAMGKAEELHSIASEDFTKNNSAVTEAVKAFKMDDETLADLEKVVLQDHKDDLDAGVDAWVKDNQDFVDSMMK